MLLQFLQFITNPTVIQTIATDVKVVVQALETVNTLVAHEQATAAAAKA